MPESALPSPGTACRALRWSGHAVQARISSALLGLHDERSALTKRRRGVLQHALLILERQEVEHVDNCHRVAVWRLVLDDVADLEAQPLRVADGPARHFDLALV